ncbi:MAG: SDR family NAD(P)-dependent oxidoreductase [Oscillospiraceae bacterium]|nr:SDR family NAD(P)-dependent oxidoreductase [Oscillospiraceae bacterium]
MTVIAVTGASGTMGLEAVAHLVKNEGVRVRVLLRDTKRGKKALRLFRRRYGDLVEAVAGDLRNYEDCLRLCEGADYLIHLAAVIPPRADHEAEETYGTNLGGTENLVRAVIETGNRAKFIHISTVAVYGDRNAKHPWGRVGDPLVTSAFDVYGQSKTAAEFAVLESGLACWAVLRQTGVLYEKVLANNLGDGLMFHTPWNVPVEWVTARDSGRLLANLVRSDLRGVADGFWRRVYNIGGGAAARQTGFETFDDGFRLMGGSAKDFFDPQLNCTRNFHCFWFSDSDGLEERFRFRTQGVREFWEEFAAKRRFYRLGGLIPAGLLRKLVTDPLKRSTNAPAYWLEHGDEARVRAYFGGREAWEKLPRRWEETELLCESEDYERLRGEPSPPLDHGYDENKPDLTLDDMRGAAAFRGGECLSEGSAPVGLYAPLRWRCHEGHEFEATPYAVLKAGHWCPECCLTPYVWRMDLVAAHSPFHAQVWRDSHAEDERFVYTLRDGRAVAEEAK